MKKITDIAISGGGMKCIGYLAALHELHQRGILNIQRISGTSMGAVIAACIVAGWTPTALLDTVFHYRFEDICRVDDNFVESYGILSNVGLRRMIESLLSVYVHPDITLEELYNRTKVDLFICTCSVERMQPVYLSHTTHPTLGLTHALLMSTAIPTLFPPVRWGIEYYVDGGVMDNCPVNPLKGGALAIQGILDTPPTCDSRIVGHFSRILLMFYMCMRGTQREDCTYITVNTGKTSVVSFSPSYDERMSLIVNGILAVENYSAVRNGDSPVGGM